MKEKDKAQIPSEKQRDLIRARTRPLTNFPHDFEVRDFDISPDGTEVVLERVEERSSVVLVDLP